MMNNSTKWIVTVATVALALAGCAPVEGEAATPGANPDSHELAAVTAGTQNEYFVAESPTQLTLRPGVTMTRTTDSTAPATYLMLAPGGGFGGGSGFGISCTCPSGCAGACVAEIGPTIATCSGTCSETISGGGMCPSAGGCAWRGTSSLPTIGGYIY